MYTDPALPREISGWHSHRLSMDMPIVRYGTRGHALLLFPTAQADYLEYERFWLVKAIEQHIFAGRCQVFSINSINRYAWMDRKVAPAEAARRQNLFSLYVENEVVPHIRRVMGDPSARIAAAGSSFGAFYAANAVFRRPDLFDTLIGMSGFYDLGESYLKGQMNDHIYFNNPGSYVPNISDAGVLHTLRHDTYIHLLSGQGAYEAPDASRRFSRTLWDKGIGNNLDLWGHDVNHDWPWWRKMLDLYVGSRLGW